MRFFSPREIHIPKLVDPVMLQDWRTQAAEKCGIFRDWCCYRPVLKLTSTTHASIFENVHADLEAKKGGPIHCGTYRLTLRRR
jgi:hypothetical protein